MGNDPIIIRPGSVADVVAAVEQAAAQDLEITVVAGGHGPWSHGRASGMRLELAALDAVDIDAAEGDVARVRIGGGATWGAVAAALAAHGLAISSGDTASVGVGGLTLGGGIGWMTRRWGLAIDQLTGAQVVTAAGLVVETSAAEHPDLFWALRGGGGNFGVVTRFDFVAHRLPGIVHGVYTGADDPAALLRATRDAMRAAPRELTVTYMDVPPMDPSAAPGASLTAVWAGEDADALSEALAPLMRVPGVQATITTPAYRDILMEMPAPASADQEPPGFIGGNGLHAALDDDLIARLVAFRTAYPASVIFLRSLGGAFGDAPQESTPFPAREAEWFAMAGGFDIPGMLDDETRAAIADAAAEIQAHRLAEYGNFVPVERPDGVAGMHTEAALQRLVETKRRWDPQNRFHRNHNIV